MSDPKRNLPSWMSSKDSGNKSKSRRKKQDDGCEGGENRTFYDSVPFSKLLEGVVFVLSGFVNPERSTLRSQALDMGAEFRPDWMSDCTLLICAFQNTPKFRQVESDCGTIVSKEWISECYNQKKLVDIEQFLMHAGKPWRKVSRQLVIHKGQENTPCKELPKQAEKRSQGGLSKSVKEHFPTSKIKEWAIEDLNKTISWLESQEEKPETSEVKAIAAEGVITCLQDAIEVLNDHKDISLVTEQWKFVPHVVKELAKLEGGRNKEGSLSKEELSKLAVTCKTIYEREYDQLNSSPIKKRKADGDEEGNVEMRISPDDAGFDSDSTIEMTEEEIELACKRLSSEYYE